MAPGQKAPRETGEPNVGIPKALGNELFAPKEMLMFFASAIGSIAFFGVERTAQATESIASSARAWIDSRRDGS